MKVSLKLVNKGMEVEIHAENDLEIIALEAWSDKYFNDKEGAFLIISREMIAPNNACTGRDAADALESKEEWASRQ